VSPLLLGPLSNYLFILVHTSCLDVLGDLLRQRGTDPRDRGQGLDPAFLIGHFYIDGIICKDLCGLPVGSYLKGIFIL
jgi:hypothetical protein